MRAASRIEEGGKGEGSSVPPCPPLKDVFRCPRVRVGVGSARKRILAARDVGAMQV